MLWIPETVQVAKTRKSPQFRLSLGYLLGRPPQCLVHPDLMSGNLAPLGYIVEHNLFHGNRNGVSSGVGSGVEGVI